MKLKTSVMLLIFIFGTSISSGWAQSAPVSNSLPKKETIKIEGQPLDVVDKQNGRPRLTLALGGGGCKSIADIGVLRSFERNNVPVDFVVGTSAGATIGALYASGMSCDDIEKLVIEGKLQKAMVPSILPRVLLAPVGKLWYIGRRKPYAGITDGKRLVKFLHKHVPATFDEMKIPFAAVATDLESGDTVMITSGNLPRSVLASAALPPLVKPVELDGRLFADGGIKANLPANCAKLTKAALIVSVLTDAAIKPVEKRKFTKLSVLANRVTDLMEAAIDRQYLSKTDILIFPDVSDTPIVTKDPDLIRKTIRIGEQAADKVMPAIKARLSKIPE